MPYSVSDSNISHKQLSLLCLGNVVAFFDFLIYLYMAQTIGRAFFSPQGGEFVTSIQTLGLFTVGYLSRPIGGLLIGHYGDIFGRKPAFIVSLIFISLTTLITAFLPTYQQIGVLAPLLFMLARILQGMAFGAHVPIGWVMIAEQTSRQSLATYCGLITASFMVGVLSARIFLGILNSSLTHQELVDFGWRIPFVVGGLLSFLLLFFHKNISETSVFLQQKTRSVGYWHGLKRLKPKVRHFNTLFLASVMTFILSSLIVVVALILPNLILMKFSLSEGILGFANGIGLLFIALGCVFYGMMADKSSVGQALIFGSVLLALQSLAFYYHLENGSGSYILLMYALLGFSSGIVTLAPVVMVQLFAPQVRLATVSLTYNTVYAFVGSSLPFVLAYLTNLISFSPALYLIFVSLVAFLMGLYVYRLPSFTQLGR